jgi:hypothetical protein
MAKNFLGLKNHIAFIKWLEGNAQKFPNMTRIEVCELASKELGFNITDNNLYGAVAAANLQLKFRRSQSVNTAAVREANRNVYTATALRDLMQALSYPVPSYIDAMANGLSSQEIDYHFAKTLHRTSS